MAKSPSLAVGIRRSTRLSSMSSAISGKPLPETHSALSAALDDTKNRKRKLNEVDIDGISVPISSVKRKTQNTKAQPISPPVTPISLPPQSITVSYSSGDIDDMTPPPTHPSHHIKPSATSTHLASPETPLPVTNPSVSDQVSPFKSSTSAIVTVKETVLEKAIAHIVGVEPRLKPFIDEHYCHVFSNDGLAEEIDPFRSLASGIIAQQVSVAAARSIKAKFISLFTPPTTFPTPAQVASTPLPTLRLAGLSQRKAEYIQGLAEKFASSELTTAKLLSASYEEVLADLIKVRGLGQWSVEMFAVFGLKKLDVFSTGDLGVQRGMAVLAGRDVKALKAKKGGKWKYMAEKDMLEMAEKFRPYRSVFMWYTWRLADIDPSVLGTTPMHSVDGVDKT